MSSLTTVAGCSLAVMFLAAAACGSDADDGQATNAGGSSASGGSGGTSAQGGSGGSGGSGTVSCSHPADCPQGTICASSGVCQSIASVCNLACDSGTYCSGVGECIAEGTCRDDVDCEEGFTCDTANEVCVPGLGCGAEEFDISAVPPNVLLVLDRTGSMDGDVPNSGGKDRWQVAQTAIENLLSAFSGDVRFGLNLFSACTGSGCAAGTIVVPIGSDPADINQAIASTGLCNSGDPETVIGGTLAAMVGESSLQDDGRDNVILLITDGQDNCSGGGAQAAADLLAQAVPVKTYVIGFSGDVDENELTAIATAAGTAPYFQANEPATLEAALQSIAANVATCTFALGSAPPDEDMYVFFNDEPGGVDEDATDGYTYDASTNSITFHGAACESIKEGTVADIDVVFGCPAPTPK